MKQEKFLIPITIFALVLSCQKSPGELTEIDVLRVKEEVNAMLNDYQREVSQDGILAELRFLDSSDEFSWHPPGFGGPIDYDSVSSILRANDPLYGKIQSTWDSLIIRPLSKTEAVYDAVLTTMMTYTNGKADTFKLAETGKVVKRKNGWKLLRGKTILKQ